MVSLGKCSTDGGLKTTSMCRCYSRVRCWGLTMCGNMIWIDLDLEIDGLPEFIGLNGCPFFIPPYWWPLFPLISIPPWDKIWRYKSDIFLVNISYPKCPSLPIPVIPSASVAPLRSSGRTVPLAAPACTRILVQPCPRTSNYIKDCERLYNYIDYIERERLIDKHG
jgi:hypothetical protein